MKCDETRMVAYDELGALAKAVLALLQSRVSEGATVLALHGDLGAGKTTITKALGRELGITEPIVSPTFTILKRYETANESLKTLFHMDAYRIDDDAELGPLKFNELLAMSNTLFCIEWADRIKAALPKGVIHLTLEIVDEHTRTVHLSCS